MSQSFRISEEFNDLHQVHLHLCAECMEYLPTFTIQFSHSCQLQFLKVGFRVLPFFFPLGFSIIQKEFHHFSDGG